MTTKEENNKITDSKDLSTFDIYLARVYIVRIKAPDKDKAKMWAEEHIKDITEVYYEELWREFDIGIKIWTRKANQVINIEEISREKNILTFKVLLSRIYKATVRADTKSNAQRLAELFASMAWDTTTFIDKKTHHIEIESIYLISNEVIYTEQRDTNHNQKED